MAIAWMNVSRVTVVTKVS